MTPRDIVLIDPTVSLNHIGVQQRDPRRFVLFRQIQDHASQSYSFRTQYNEAGYPRGGRCTPQAGPPSKTSSNGYEVRMKPDGNNKPDCCSRQLPSWRNVSPDTSPPNWKPRHRTRVGSVENGWHHRRHALPSRNVVLDVRPQQKRRTRIRGNGFGVPTGRLTDRSGRVGKYFKFKLEAMGMEAGGELVQVPPGETVLVVARNSSDQELVYVRWQGRKLTMFAEEIRSRAEEVEGLE